MSRLSIAPSIPTTRAQITSPKHADAVARVLNGRGPTMAEKSLFCTVVRAYLRGVPEARGGFTAWYEALPE